MSTQKGSCLFLVLFTVGMILPVQAQEEIPPERLLLMSFEELLNVEISTAGKRIEKVKDIPSSVIVITRDEIARMGYATLTEIFQNTPGLYTINDLAYADDVIGVRGYWSYEGAVIILVNGVEMVNDIFNLYAPRFFNIPVEAIDRIEVVRGPMSVMYGSKAFFGAINIITDRSDEGAGNLAALGYGSQNTRKAFLRTVAVSDALALIFNGGIRYTQGPDVPLSTMSSDPATYLGLPDNTRGRLEQWNRAFNTTLRYKQFQINTAYTCNPIEEYFFFPSASDGYRTFNELWALTTQFEDRLSPRWTFKLKGGYRKSYLRRTADYFHDNYRGQEIADVSSWHLEGNLTFNANAKMDFFMGFQYSEITDLYEDLNHAELDIHQLQWHLADENKIRTQAVFGQWNVRPWTPLKITAGLRLERLLPYDMYWSSGSDSEVAPYTSQARIYNEDGIEFIPSFAAIWQIHSRHLLKWIYGKAINKPSFAQNIQQVYSGYPNLQPAYIETHELNYLGTLHSGLDIEVSLFKNSLNNLFTRIHYFDQDQVYHTYYGNGGKIETWGGEMALTASIHHCLNFNIAATYQSSQDKRNGYGHLDVAYSPQWLLYAKAVWQPSSAFSLAVYGYYVDDMQTLWEGLPNPELGGGRIAQATAGYTNLSANLRLNNLFNWDLFLSIKGTNLLNKTILYPQFTNNQGWADKGSIGPVRSVLVTIGKAF